MMQNPPVVDLAPVVPPDGEPPDDIGTGHPMREVTESVAADPSIWTRSLARKVGAMFDELSDDWAVQRSERSAVLADALERGHGGGPLTLAGVVLELGAGTGAGTRVLRERATRVVAGDISAGMLAHLPGELADRVQLDASVLPFADGSVDTLVCVNMLLFPREVRRVLAPSGYLVWVNSIGERTPIHLSARAVAGSLGDGFETTASRCGWGTWAVALRSPSRVAR